MLNETKNKAVLGWWVYKDATTGRWVYATRDPGLRHGGKHGPLGYRQAVEKQRELSLSIKGPDVCDIYQA